MTITSFDELVAAYGLSDDAADRIARLDRAFVEWSAAHNLVARSTIPQRWDRHYADSLQLLPLIPRDAATLIDLGAGGGFPSLVLAAALAGRGVAATLVESVGKKCAYLRAAAEAAGLDVDVRAERIEATAPRPFDVVTARALAPLPKLLGYVARFVGPETVAILPKGQDVESELTEAAKSWTFNVSRQESATRPDAQILEVRRLARRRPKARPHSRRRQPEGRRR